MIEIDLVGRKCISDELAKLSTSSAEKQLRNIQIVRASESLRASRFVGFYMCNFFENDDL